MGDAEILKETKVKFPRSLTIEETEKLFEYVSNKIGYSIRYNITIENVVGQLKNHEGPYEINRDIADCCMTDSIANVITHSNFFVVRDHATSPASYKRFEFAFDRFIRHVDLDQHPKESIKLWRDTANYVKGYFERPETPKSGKKE